MGRAFEKRKHTIFARMDRVAKQFSKINKDIAIAVKNGGSSPDGNPALRRALVNARAVNMPKDKVEAMIKKASGQGATDYAIVMYEGYAAHGIAVMVETATDNVTRTVANVRHAFKAFGGNMGTTGSVSFMFQHQGVFRLNPEGIDRDTLELELIDDGLVALEDGESDKGDKQLVVRCAFNDWGTMQTALEKRGITAASSTSEYVAATLSELPEEKADDVMKLVARLEEDDDVQNVYSNLGVVLIALNKPYLVHTKFTDDEGRPTLAQFGLPPRVYVAGRLDHDSEGLLLLTDDGKLNQRLTDPRWKAPKTYAAQVEGVVTEEALAKLRAGVELKDGKTLPAEASTLDEPAWLWPRTPPIRFRKSVPDAWISLTIREGRNRQVRRMTAAVGLPTLRLIRLSIGAYELAGLAPGQWREV